MASFPQGKERMTPYDHSIQARFFGFNYGQFVETSVLKESELHDYIREHKKLDNDLWLKKYKALQDLRATLDVRQILYPGHAEYPVSLSHIDEPPLFLMVEGDRELLQSPGISVVGRRDPDERFLMWMDTELKDFLRESRAVTISGGARGVDQKASHVACREGTGSVIILPSGLGSPYPRGVKALFPPPGILFMSEYFPYEEMFKGQFVRRNRLISALGRLLLAVQFEVRSGTMITVNYAIAQNKEVVTVPDHPLCGRSSGNLKLMEEGAFVVQRARDLQSLWRHLVKD